MFETFAYQCEGRTNQFVSLFYHKDQCFRIFLNQDGMVTIILSINFTTNPLFFFFLFLIEYNKSTRFAIKMTNLWTEEI